MPRAAARVRRVGPPRPLARPSPLAAALAAAIALATCGAKPGSPLEPPPVERRTEIDAGAGVAQLAVPATGMAYVSGGTFRMGSTVDEARWAGEQCAREPLGGFCRSYADELVAHDVTLSPYFLDRTEVTLGAYRRCVDAAACGRAAIPPGDPRADRDELPVTYVNHSDAERYCAFRGARLPTEAEWERAARGLAGRRFPWGELWNPHLANHGAFDFGARFYVNPFNKAILIDEGTTDDVDGFAGPAPSGSFASYGTPEGISDLAGNVAEWVLDLYELEYPAAPARDPRNVTPKAGSSGVLRVVRGGSYLSPFVELRGAARGYGVVSERRRDLGFRCARDAT
jgi:formylglycine-generating enzyme required for sulfatase activity